MKYRAFFLLLLLLIAPIGAPALEWTDAETAQLVKDAALYRDADAKSAVYGVVPAGEAVSVRALRDDWAQVEYRGRTGYLRASAIIASVETADRLIGVSMLGRTLYVCESGRAMGQRNALSLSEGDQVMLLGYTDDTADVLHKGRYGTVALHTLAPDRELCYPLGATGDSIVPLQNRLEALGYYDGSAHGFFDLETAAALIRFRVQLGLPDEFLIDDETRAALFADEAPQSLIRIAALAVGDTGNSVGRLQARLRAKGYLDGGTPGYFDGLTSQAVWMYQEVAQIPATGQADPATLASLFSATAPYRPADRTAVTEETAQSLPGAVVVKDWFEDDIQEIYAIGVVARYTDIETGLSWNEIRKGGTNHADTQPLTAEDTAVLNMIVGGVWTWERRAVWVTIDGVRYAASINCMPHGEGSIDDNDFAGHHCTHFLNSRTHAGNQIDERHQACVQIAARTAYVTTNYNAVPVDGAGTP